MRVEPVAGALGAELSGVQIGALTDGEFDAVHQALLDYEVVFFREQQLSPEAHRDFALRFGEVVGHPAYPHPDGVPEVTILEHTAEKPSKIECWHTDMTFMEKPPLGSILRGRVVPDRGGDTLWASMTAAFDALSPPLRELTLKLEAWHDFSWGFKESLAEPGGRERLAGAVAANPPRKHPVVRTHPLTGRKALFVNRLFTTRIDGLSGMESKHLLDLLCEHAVQPQFTVRFRWTPDAVVMWDNRCTQHVPVNDHGLSTRVMERVTVLGDAPR